MKNFALIFRRYHGKRRKYSYVCSCSNYERAEQVAEGYAKAHGYDSFQVKEWQP